MDKEPGGPRIIESYGGVPLHAQSHAESFLARLRLRPTRQMSALVRIHQLVQNGAQFVDSTHSPILMAYPNAWIYRLDEDGIMHIAYEETEHYQITRDFLDNHQMMLDVLLVFESTRLLASISRFIEK